MKVARDAVLAVRFQQVGAIFAGGCLVSFHQQTGAACTSTGSVYRFGSTTVFFEFFSDSDERARTNITYNDVNNPEALFVSNTADDFSGAIYI